MATMAPNDPILKRFRAAIAEIYGDRLERVVLYGSRARGDAQPHSDYDVAVFLRDMPDRLAELDRLAALRLTFLDDTGAFFDALPYSASAYGDGSPLMHEIRREGLDL
jgi:predicted nucleotidyltransferase